MAFSAIRLPRFRQYRDIEVDLRQPVTFLLGRNGTGKTTILHVLAGVTGTHPKLHYLDIPTGKDDTMGWVRMRDGREHRISAVGDKRRDIGLMAGVHTDDVVALVPSILPRPPRTRIEGHPNRFGSYSDAARHLARELLLSSFGTGGDVARVFKQQILGASGADLAMLNSFLESVLGEGEVWGPLQVDAGEAFVALPQGRTPIESVNGGLWWLAITGWMAHLLSRGRGSDVPALLLDEPEIHLHPSVQRLLLPSLQRHFEGLQLVVATHSPLILASVEIASTSTLEVQDGRVYSRDDSTARPRSVDEALEKWMGLPFAGPLWIEQEVESLIGKYPQMGPEQAIEVMRELRNRGLVDGSVIELLEHLR